MTVSAQVCPHCGAPLTIVSGHCSFCRTPLTVSVEPGSPPPAPPPPPWPVGDANGSFVMTVDDVFSIKGRGTVVTGRIAAGTVRVGDRLVIAGPSGTHQTECAAIESFRKQLDAASAGDNVGLMLKNIDKTHVAAGDQLRLAP